MADLPDIDTTQVSFIGYWNALEQGGATDDLWSADEVLSFGRVASSTTYDNGVDGTVNFLNGRTANFRSKSDGWVVVWIDTTAEVTNNSQSRVSGPWDITADWVNHCFSTDNTDPAPYYGTSQTDELTRAIKGLWNATSASGDINTSFTASDVGFFNYENTGATNFSFFADDQPGLNDNSYTDYNQIKTGGLQYTDSTSIKQHFILAVAKSIAYDGSRDDRRGDSRVIFDGVNLADSIDDGNKNVSVCARLASNLGVAQQSGVEAPYSLEAGETNSLSSSLGWNGGTTLHNVIIWG